MEPRLEIRLHECTRASSSIGCKFHRLWRVRSFPLSRRIGQTLASFVGERPVTVDRDGAVAVLQRHKRGRARAAERIKHKQISVACRDNNPSHKLCRKGRWMTANISGMTNLPDRGRVVTQRIEQHADICPCSIVAYRAGLWFGTNSMGTD